MQFLGKKSELCDKVANTWFFIYFLFSGRNKLPYPDTVSPSYPYNSVLFCYCSVRIWMEIRWDHANLEKKKISGFGHFLCIHFHNMKHQIYLINRLAFFPVCVEKVWAVWGSFAVWPTSTVSEFRVTHHNPAVTVWWKRYYVWSHESFNSYSSFSLKLFRCLSSCIMFLSTLPLPSGSICSDEDEFISARIRCQPRSRAVCFYAHLPIGISVTCLDTSHPSSSLWNAIGS